MSHNFYTSVHVVGSKIVYRGVEGSKRVQHKIEYSPTLYIPTKEPTKFRTIRNEPVAPIQPGNIYDCREFVKKYTDTANFQIYGNQRYEYAFIQEHFKEHIEWDRQYIKIANLDIEVGSENGFPQPETASEEITAITIRCNGKSVIFGCGTFITDDRDITYIKCRDEIDLIKRFILEWSSDYPDAITGWHIKFFDIPYLINRINKLLGETWSKRLSPWGRIHTRTVVVNNKEHECYVLLGVATLDYFELYRKFAPNGMSQESYRLDHICEVEIGEKKLQFEGSLHKLYKDNFQKFIEYNNRDTFLVEKLDDKLKLLDLAFTLAYDSKSNFEDVFTQTRMWDAIIHHHLLEKNIVVPPAEKKEKAEAYVGAYVKEPIVGKHTWIASFDLNSLYPHLIQQFNISPDMLIEPEDYTFDMQQLLLRNPDVDKMLHRELNTETLKKDNVTITPNGQFFSIKKQGFLSCIMQEMYEDRTRYKKEMLNAKKELQKTDDQSVRQSLERKIARFNNLQLAKKVCL